MGFNKCAVCGTEENEGQRLCKSCEALGETFLVLNSPEPGQQLVDLIQRTKGSYSRLLSVFYYLRESQLEKIEQVIAYCQSQGIKADKSKVMRLALHLGLIQIFAMSASELGAAIAVLENKPRHRFDAP